MCVCVTSCSPSFKCTMSIDRLRRRLFAQSEPFSTSPMPDELERAVLENTAFRRVLFTSHRRPSSQQVAMCIGNESSSIGWEKHDDTVQYFAVIEGSGTLVTSSSSSSSSSNKNNAKRVKVSAGSKWLIEPGTWHDVESNGQLKLLTIYFPSHHAPGTVHQMASDQP